MKLETVKRNFLSTGTSDFFETQDSTIDLLYNNYLKNRLDFSNSIVADFSCGKNAILNRLKSLDDTIETFGSDIEQRDEHTNLLLDMFETEKIIANFKNTNIQIIMNPPFNKLTETLEYYLFLKKKYTQIKSLSLLHSIRSLEGKKRHEIMQTYGYPSLILNMTKRQAFNTYFDTEKRIWIPAFSVCWSIWDSENNGKTEFRYI